jgi:hypothetical protein
VAEPELAVGDLVEETCLLIRHSAAVQEARTEAFLDAAIVAAFQVHDVRLQALETPAELTGWEFFGELLLTIILESNVVGKILGKVTRKMFTSVLRTNALFRALPKSPTGKELAFYARFGRSLSTGKTFSSSLRGGFPEVGIPGLASKNPLKLYHTSIRRLVDLGSNDEMLSAMAKAGVQGYRSRKPWEEPTRTSDSATMAVVSAAQDYARATRLGIRVSHSRIESYVRRGIPPAELVPIIDTLSWEPLDDSDVDDEATGLARLRDEYALLFEALIWARLYGFSQSPDFPPLLQREDAFYGVNEYVNTYWRRRFQSAADWYLTTVEGATVVRGDTNQALRLRRYFADLSLEMTKQVDKHNFGPNAFEPMRPQPTAP